jgi:hypothetical protein
MSIVIEFFYGSIIESVNLLHKMSTYLLFGFLFAGILHMFINVDSIVRHFGQGSIIPVLKAAMFGIPLPLCSCGVVPAALMLKNKGASKGAVLSFLITTPTSGVDSIAATYSLLGPMFTIYRVIASGLTGIFAGIIGNIISRDDKYRDNTTDTCVLCDVDRPHVHTLTEKIFGGMHYAFIRLLGDISKWLIIGILIGGIISYVIPSEFIENYLGSGWQAMIIMLIIGIPSYVCATGSIPIVAALIAKGMTPGAGFVFLLAGPATNITTLTILLRILGIKSVVVYILSIIICCIGFGWLLDIMFTHTEISIHIPLHGRILPYWLQITSTVILLTLIGYNWLKSAYQYYRQ